MPELYDVTTLGIDKHAGNANDTTPLLATDGDDGDTESSDLVTTRFGMVQVSETGF